MGKGPALPNWLAASIISLAVGGVFGFYVRDFRDGGREMPSNPASAPARGAAGATAGGAGGQQEPGMMLVRLVRNLSVVERIQNQGLTPAQAKSLLPIFEEIKSAERLPEAEVNAKIDAVGAALTDQQQAALRSLAPQRGGGGGRAEGMGSGGPSSAGTASMARGGQQAQDPEKPFANERNLQALDDFIAHLKSKAQ